MTARFLCIGTHHKTGTIWMRKVWKAVAAEQSIPFMQVNRPKKLAEAAPTGPQIMVNWSSRFPAALFQRPEARFLHIIRDPRDVLLSGMRYHRIAPLGNEKFLRERREAWEGRSYQEQINALPDDRARLLFEMEEKHAVTLAEMLDWPWGHPNAIELRYEDLIADTDCSLMRAALERAAIAGLDIDRALARYWDLSLFGGLADPAARGERVSLHVGSGRAAQWRRKLPRDVAEIYADRFGPALKSLGYAEDDGWVRDCPAPAEAAPLS